MQTVALMEAAPLAAVLGFCHAVDAALLFDGAGCPAALNAFNNDSKSPPTI